MKYEKMAVVRLTFILLLQCIFLINIKCDNEFQENSDELYRPQIWCFVNYLNANPDRLYNYNYGTLINAQNKEVDNTDLTIDVDVECRNNKNACDVNLLECIGTVKYNTDTANYEVLPGATCSQKSQVESTSNVNSDQDYSPTDAPQEEIETKSEYYSNAEPVQEQFFKKTVPLLGGPVDLNHNIEGLDILTNTALKHIESERNYKLGLVRVIRVQRQIVSGVKYILTLEIAPTNCPKNLETTYTCSIVTSAEPEICEITYYQQPWISHRKNIISNNCTETQEFSEDGINSAANDQDNEIDTNYNPKKPYGYPDQPEQGDHMPVYPNYDVIADTGNADDILKMTGAAAIDAARLRDIESQIIQMFDSPKTTTSNTRDQEIASIEQDISKVNAENRESSFLQEATEMIDTTTDEITTENPMLTDAQKAAFDDFMDMMESQPRIKRNTKDDDSSSSSSSSSSEEDNDNNGNDKEYEKTKRKSKKYTKKGRNDNNDDNGDDDDDDDNNDDNNGKKNKDDSSSSSSSSSSSEEDNNGNGKKHKNKKTKRAADDDSSSSEENNAKIQEHPSSSSSEEGNQEDNRTKRQAKPDSSESNETSEEKTAASSTVATLAQNLIAQNKDTSEESSSEEHRGGVRRKRSLSNDLIKISPEEKNFVHNLAEFSTRTLDDIDADNHKRVILQVLGAKKNVAGNLYYLTVRVGVSKCPEENNPIIDLNKEFRKDKCRNKLFENLTKICKVEIKVDDNKINAKVEKSQCQNMKKEQDDSDVNRTNRGMFRSKRGSERLAGGINKVDPESSEIKQYVKNVLLELNANKGEDESLKFVKVHEASKQIVSGVLYRFKVEIKEGAVTKICSIHVWDQAWLNPPKEVKITCDGGEEKKYRFKRASNLGIFGKDDHDVHIGLFKDFMQKHNKQYSSKTEFKNRFRVFKQNMKTIKLLNENEQGTAKYGPTMFADLTVDEYKQYLGLRPEMRNINNIPMPKAVIPDVDLPVEFDWRKKGVISEVKNQGSCGSCWAFSVTGNIEGLNAIKTGNLIELSEQELVDCDTLDSGCNGGLPDNAYRAIEQLGGLETETDYPYEAENEKCVFNKTLTKVQISGAVNISTNETDMAKWLIKNGPISIGINANAMQFYMGGVSHPWKFLCNPGNLDHGVLIVGYGTHKYPLFNKVMPYWTIKNSWGPTWGEQGYYRVYRGDGTCGVNMMASSAVL